MSRIDVDKLFEHSGESKLSDLYAVDDIDKELDAAIIDVDAEYAQDEFIMQFIEDEGRKIDIMSLGNISVCVGGAKSKKTFFASMLLSAFVSNKKEFAMIGDRKGKKVLLIDTEQSKSHVQRVARRIKRITGIDIKPHIDVLAFREVPDPKMRLAMIERHLSKNADKYAFLFVDGYVDVVNDYNNQEECRKVTGLFMSWSSIYNIHISGVIHTNKDGVNARGHLGSELKNKSEVVFRIAKEEGDCSSVTNEDSRNKAFQPFEFYVDDKGLPQRSSYPTGYYTESYKEIKDYTEPSNIMKDTPLDNENFDSESGTPF